MDVDQKEGKGINETTKQSKVPILVPQTPAERNKPRKTENNEIETRNRLENE